jgi:hypothetical protein
MAVATPCRRCHLPSTTRICRSMRGPALPRPPLPLPLRRPLRSPPLQALAVVARPKWPAIMAAMQGPVGEAAVPAARLPHPHRPSLPPPPPPRRRCRCRRAHPRPIRVVRSLPPRLRRSWPPPTPPTLWRRSTHTPSITTTTAQVAAVQGMASCPSPQQQPAAAAAAAATLSAATTNSRNRPHPRHV